MSLDTFISRWDGSTCDFDGAYGGQCMDIMHQYVQDELDLSGSYLRASYAYLVYTNFTKMNGNQFFERIPNTPTGVPQKGDIVFWDKNISGVTGEAGHVAIFVSGDSKAFTSFDQNYPIGSKCHKQAHSYKGVLGWLRVKPSQNEAPTAPESTDMSDLTDILAHYNVKDKNELITMVDQQLQFLESAREDNTKLQSQIDELDSTVKTLTDNLAKQKQDTLDALDAKDKEIAALRESIGSISVSTPPSESANTPSPAPIEPNDIFTTLAKFLRNLFTR